MLGILKKYSSSVRKRLALGGSLLLVLILTATIISSLFLSDTALQKLARSQYLQSKVYKVLKQNEIYPENLISIEFRTFGIAHVNIDKAELKKFGTLVCHDINFKVDFIKYWLGLSFVNEVSIKELVYNLPKKLSLNSNEAVGLDVQFLTPYLYQSLNKLYSKSIYIKKGSLKIESETFEFRNIHLAKNKELLTAEASLGHNENLDGTSFYALANLSLNNANILNFNIDLQANDFKSFFRLGNLSKMVRSFLDSSVSDAALLIKNPIAAKLVGAYDLNSTNFEFELSNPTDRFGFKSTINILKSVNAQSLLFKNAELGLKDFSLLLSDLDVNLTDQTFEARGTEVFTPNASSFGFLDKVIIKGMFPSSDNILAKINIIGEDPSRLNASLKIVDSSIGSDDESPLFDFFVALESLKKTNLKELGFLSRLFSLEDNSGINLSNAVAQVGVRFGRQSIEFKSFKGKIDELIYLKNNKSFIEFDNIDLEANSQQGYATIRSLTKVKSSMRKYKDIVLEFSSTRDIEKEKEVTLSFKSNIGDLISLTTQPNNNLTWVDFLTASQGEKEVLFTYTKEVSLNKIEDFFTLEDIMFELDIENLKIPLTAENTLELATLNLKGIGDTIFFDGVIASNNKEIRGSIYNGLPHILSKNKDRNLIMFIENFSSNDFFPKLSAFSVNGPIELTFLPVRKNEKTVIRSNIKVTNANVHIPSLALKKMKGVYGKLKFDFKKDNKSSFEYSQNNVFVSGSGIHETIFKVNKVNYSSIKTPDIQIRGATFEKFSNYNQFKTNKGTISLDFLTNLSFKNRKIPLDIVFSDLVVTLNKNVFLESVKGEVRSFKGLRGYAKAEFLSKSNLEVILSPHKDSGINLVVSGNDAGELLRRGDYYKNGFGGIFKASIVYKNKNQIDGSVEIKDFRLKNAPVLAQIISSASIVGLLDNLNGNGLLFTKIAGTFVYKEDKLTLKDGVAVGPSLGLTMNGFERYGKRENIVDVRGVVSPVYIINGVVKAIPIIGKIFGGEKGEGVFGVSYKVLGKSSNPKVLVNPLSILTPGAFRKIFSVE